MEIKKEVNGTTLTVSLIGQLDLAASGNLKKELDDALKGTKEVIFDLSELTYVASAGLRDNHEIKSLVGETYIYRSDWNSY